MTDKLYKQTKRRVDALLDEWLYGKNPRMISLKQWVIGVSYMRHGIESGRGAVARVTSDWMYKTATLELDMPEMAKCGDLELEQYVVHELCHIMVSEMREYGDKKGGHNHEERVVTELALSFLGTKYRDDKSGKGKDLGK